MVKRAIMICAECGKEMEIDEGVVDYHDPSKTDGHGQYEYKIWVCECGYSEEYVEETDED